jgi:hypothetical protein
MPTENFIPLDVAHEVRTLYPLSPDDALRAVLAIKPADVKRIIASKPGKKKAKKK